MSLNPTITYYGASCEGAFGEWFTNVVVSGGTGTPNVSYRLLWSFSSSKVARPIGQITSHPGKDRNLVLTINNGVYTIAGTTAKHIHVRARGTLNVALAGTALAPTLVFTETGLTNAERALKIVSPFSTSSGQPYAVPIKIVSSFPSC
jgi:hypothetical protein